MSVKKNEFSEAVAKSTEAKLKEKYEEEEIEEVAKILRKPLRITGGITGQTGEVNEIGFWSAKEVIPRVFSKLLDEDYNINDYYDLIGFAESDKFKDTLAQDYLEIYEYFERNWELIKDPEIKL